MKLAIENSEASHKVMITPLLLKLQLVSICFFFCFKVISFVARFYFSQYIGSKETDFKADEVSKLGIFDCWTPENHYRWSRSRYGGHISATVETVDQSQLLLCSMILQTLFFIGVF